MLKAIYSFMMRLMVSQYRRTKGKFGGQVAGLPVLLLTTTGRKSGKQHTTPLGFLEDNGDYVIIASNGGQDKNPAWFHNLKANPNATIEIKDQPLQVTAEVALPDRRSRLWDRLVKLSPQYGGYEKKTTREIPMIILHPIQSQA